MTISTTSLGANSARIDYMENDTFGDLLSELHDQIVAKGQTSEDTDWFSSGAFTEVRTYSHVNDDGVTKKYFQIKRQGGYIFVAVLMDYDPITKTGTYFLNSEDNKYSWYGQRVNLPSYGGSLYVCAHARQFILHSTSESGIVGAGYATGFSGLVECKTVHPEDDPAEYPCYTNIYSYVLQGSDSANYRGPFCFMKSKQYGQGSLYTVRGTQAIVPHGAQGNLGGSYFQLNSIVGSTPDVQSLSNYCYDIGAIQDTISSNYRYFKGNLFGLKVMNTSFGTLGDILKVKVDAEYNIDPEAAGTTDFLILVSDAYRFGIPA